MFRNHKVSKSIRRKVSQMLHTANEYSIYEITMQKDEDIKKIEFGQIRLIVQKISKLLLNYTVIIIQNNTNL